jgi:MoaA/NifB/PqqE/SkfB family radical SAM enzyme
MENVTPGEPTHPEKKKGKGCKIALIIVGILVVIAIIAGYFICTNIEKIAKFAITKSIDAFEVKIMDNLPDGYDEAEVKEVFENARRAFKEGKLSGEETGMKVQEISMTFQHAFDDDELTTEELDELLQQIRELSDSHESDME